MSLVLGRRWLAAAARRKAALSTEQEFQRLTPLEHILTCPNMYIGATSPAPLSSTRRQLVSKMTPKKLSFAGDDAALTTYVPGLVKIFDEVLVNACDNAIRDPLHTKCISVSFDGQTFVVENDGRGIPVVMHPKEQLYVPELVMGHLLTGSNFDKSADKDTTGGRHGYGAKLANVFSTSFACETVDAERGKRFSMQWRNNMREVAHPARVEDVAVDSTPYTRVSFSPDWDRFGEAAATTAGGKKKTKKTKSTIDSGSLLMIQTRVMETAGLLGPAVQVKWNGHAVPQVSDFASLCQAIASSSSDDHHHHPVLMLMDRPGKLRVALARSRHSQFEHTSYVNNMSTWRGGVHVNLITQQICRYIQANLVRGKAVSEADIKRHLHVFVELRSHQPEFDSQSKEKLTGTSDMDQLSSSVPDAAMKRIAAGLPDLLQDIERTLEARVLRRANTALASSSSTSGGKQRLVVPKLEDALWAGTGRKTPCTLILTEGDSAKASAMCGLEVVGREQYGVYPLRGKLLNVRGLPLATVADNQEIKNIAAILGLKFGAGASSSSSSSLRYSRVMFMTDGDHDGSHIKGLLINLFDTFWPELARTPGFLTQFVTPLLKALPVRTTSSSSSKLPVMSFFSLLEYEAWRKATSQDTLNQYRIKYYKGLGTSSPAEAREYFSRLDEHVVDFVFEDGKKSGRANDAELIDLAFSKTRAADRKQWLSEYRPSGDDAPATSSSSSSSLAVSTFINQELIQYSLHNNDRSIPHVLDGLKPSQRKVLFALLLKTTSTSAPAVAEHEEFKLTRLAGFVAEQTSYHHGETSLHATMIKMAQDFVGSNNLPLLCAVGQFGSRATGGEDASAARYLSTRLCAVARVLFPAQDDALLRRREDDGVEIEPEFYVPIVPLVLVNGSHGVGTGWSSNCPQFHPLHVSRAVRAWIETAPPPELHPWYRGFRGTIAPSQTTTSGGGYTTHGVVELVVEEEDKAVTGKKKMTRTKKSTPTKLVVRELPVGMWTEDFKQYLNDRVEAKQQIAGFVELGRDGEIEIEVQLIKDADEEDGAAERIKLELEAKLTSHLSMQNLHFHPAAAVSAGRTSNGVVKRFHTVHEIVVEFCRARLALYVERRARELDKTKRELDVLERERDFVQRVCGGGEGGSKTKKAQLVKVLGEELAVVQARLAELGFSQDEAQVLLRKPLRDFTLDRVRKLDQAVSAKRSTLAELEATTPERMWVKELDRFDAAIAP